MESKVLSLCLILSICLSTNGIHFFDKETEKDDPKTFDKTDSDSSKDSKDTLTSNEKDSYISKGSKDHLKELKDLKKEFTSEFSELKESYSQGKSELLKEKFAEKYKPDKQSERPLCPVKIKPTYEEAIVEVAAHSVVTVEEHYNPTHFEYITETTPYIVYVTETNYVTETPTPVSITETHVIPEERTVTQVKMITKNKDYSETSLRISTLTAEETITTTQIEPEWVTVTDHTVEWTTHTKTIDSTTVEWVTHVITMTQPTYITTSIVVEAPQLKVITSTKSETHYMTTTVFTTKELYTTVCDV